MKRLLVAAIMLGAAMPAALRAQSASALVEQGVRAYNVREYDGGAWLLRRALAAEGSGSLSNSETARALLYLSAIELVRNQRDSALAAARRLLVIDSKFRPDEQLFPPPVIALYQEARRSSPSVAMRVPGDTEIRPGLDAFVVRLSASATPEVAAAVTHADGRVVRSLFSGVVRDTLELRWNGLDASGNPPPAGRYAILVTPAGRPSERRGSWQLKLPLELVRSTVDTTPLPPPPPDSLFRPERGNTQGAWRALIPGVVAAAAIVVLPNVVASGERASNTRLIVGGTVAVAGIAAFLSHRPGQSLPGNTRYNRNLRETWKRNTAEVSRKNAERMRQAKMIIRPGAPAFVAGETP